MARYIGVDGFRLGWVAAWIDDTGNQGFDYSPNIECLLSLSHRRAMIDIPIGLPDTGHRECDVQARRRLGTSVFLGARRNLLEFRSQADANQHYWSFEGKGMGVSAQLWNIREKIKEVDGIVTPDRQMRLCETHPELIFQTRNRNELLNGKKTEAGRQQRLAILRRLGFTQIDHWLELRFRTGIGRDDLIDACVCAIAARDATSKIGGANLDSRGLRMEIHF